MDRIRVASLVALVWLALTSTALAVTGQGVWIAFPTGTTCPNYNTAPINDQTLCYDSVTGWQVFHGSSWVLPNIGGIPCSQLPALTGDVTTSAGSCATTSTAGKTPGGRLTLTTGTPVMTADATAQTTIFYDTYVTNTVPVSNAYLTITSNEISVILDTTNDLSGSLYDIYAINSSGSLKLCTGPAWTSTSARGSGAGTTELQLSNGVWTNKNSLTHCWNNSVDQGPISANAGTYLGTFDATANGQTGMQFQPAGAAGGSNNILGLYNEYNRVPVTSVERDSTASWTYNSATWRVMDNNNNNRITWVDGRERASVTGTCQEFGSAASASGGVGCDLNATTGAPTVVGKANTSGGSSFGSRVGFVPALGLNFIQGMEQQDGNQTETFNGTGAQTQFVQLEVQM